MPFWGISIQSADAQHVVLGDHHARDQPQDRVLEYQHQDGREAPSPVIRLTGDLSIRIETTTMTTTQEKIT